MAKMWSLIAVNVSPRSAGLMAKLGMRASALNAKTFWRHFQEDDRAPVLAAIAMLREAGIHGIAKREDVRQPAKTSRFRSHGFGGRLNATAIDGAWRRRKRRR